MSPVIDSRTKITLSPGQWLYLVGLLFAICGLWFDVRTQLALIKKDIQFQQQQIDELREQTGAVPHRRRSHSED